MSDESDITKAFGILSQDIKNNGKTTKSISVKGLSNTINLYPLIIKLQSAEKTELQKHYGFEKAFNIFDEIDNKCNKLNEYKSKKKIDVKYKGYFDKKLNELMYRDPHRIKEIINAFKFKRLGKIKTEEPFIESKELLRKE